SFGFGGYSKTSLLPKSPNRREATFLPRQQKSESLQAGEVTDSWNLQPIGCNKISTIPITVKRRSLMGTHQQSWCFTKVK
ncbi:MAG: hypothetical protein QGH33_02465, partial [Pirellulaceae bacterium]|nr:hypothetical protein [Pirellulaceae bacterium]